MKQTFTFGFFLFVMNLILGQANFEDISAWAGVGMNGQNYGIAIADYDNDGLEDIYVSRHYGTNLLFKATANGTYVEVAAQAGVNHSGTTTMSIFGDINNDGYLDLYLGNRLEPNILYLNNGDGTFTDISAAAEVNEQFWTKAVMFGDLDNDGYIDLYVANLSAPNALYRNKGDLTFINLALSSGAQDYGIAMGSMLFDYDNDGDLDIYLTHDANQPNILYRNDGNLQFTNVSSASNTNYAGNGMGVDFGDVNNDGFLDIYITNLSYNTLLLNNGDGTFTNITFQAGVEDTGMGWGTVWLDYDNDGFQDIYLANDSYFSPKPNVLYRNRGNNTFENVSAGTVLASMYGGYGVGVFDTDRDGRLDLYLANTGNDGNQLFRNNSGNGNHWVKVKTQGTVSNRAGIGARVEVLANGRLHVDEVCSGSGYATQNSLTIHLGLGQATIIDQLRVKWPSGITDTFFNLDVDKVYKVIENENVITSETDLSKIPPSLGIFPNPFSESTTVSINLHKAGRVQAGIWNVQGQKVRTLFEGRLQEGEHSFSWDGSSDSGAWAGNGMYFLRVQTEEGIEVRMIGALR
jgi:enediyne biosynthesis protein E4